MPKLFNRKPEPVAVDWREEPKLVKAQARLAEVKNLLAPTEAKVRGHDATVASADEAVTRSELEVLAGRGSEATLAAKQAALIDARRQRAHDMLQLEDLRDEQAKLEAALPSLERTAKLASAKAVRADYLRKAAVLRDALQAVIDADKEVAELTHRAGEYFPAGRNEGEPAMSDRAGCWPIARTQYYLRQGVQEHVRPGGVAGPWLARVKEAMEAAEKLAAEHDA